MFQRFFFVRERSMDVLIFDTYVVVACRYARRIIPRRAFGR